MKDKLFQYLLILTPCSLLISDVLNVYIIIALVVVWLILPWHKQPLRLTPYSVIFISLYLVQIFGLIYTSDIHEGLFQLEKKAALAVFPILLLTRNIRIDSKNIVSAFVITCTLVTVYFYLYAIINVFKGTSYSAAFSKETIDSAIGIHGSYLSMYCGFSALMLLYISFQHITSAINKAILISGVFNFLLFMIIIGARTPLTAAIFLITFFLIYYSVSKKNKLAGIMVIIIVGFLGYALMTKNTFSNKIERLMKNYKTLEIRSTTKKDGEAQLRLARYSCSVDVWSNNFILGVGTGDANTALTQCYLNNNYLGFDRTFNAHNEYLQEALRTGLVGLGILLVGLFYPLIISWKTKHMLYFLFLSLIILCFISESMLSVQKGVIFYSFFNSIFASKFD